MVGIMLLFAFSMSVVINLVEKKINPEDGFNEAEEMVKK
jgi:hypothetical protein